MPKGNLLQWGAAFLVRNMDRHAASSVVYRRGQSVWSWRAVKGRSTFNVTETDGTMVQAETVDWIGIAAYLVAEGIPVVPRQGDRIIDELGIEYEVCHPTGAQPYQWDESRTQYRIHTKRVTADLVPLSSPPLHP